MSDVQRVWLAMIEGTPVPYGPTRNINNMTDKDLSHYRSCPDADGVMQDGTPFGLFVREGDSVVSRVITPADTEITVLGRSLKLRWIEAVTDPGMMVVVTGDINAGDSDSLAPENPGDDGRRQAIAYCLAWNAMGVGASRIDQTLCLKFGLPPKFGFTPKPKPPAEGHSEVKE